MFPKLATALLIAPLLLMLSAACGSSGDKTDTVTSSSTGRLTPTTSASTSRWPRAGTRTPASS